MVRSPWAVKVTSENTIHWIIKINENEKEKEKEKRRVTS
jgi:hypothetical protein